MAIAPTGTISLIADVSSGIEPIFAKSYRRSDRVSDRVYIHPRMREYIDNKEEIPDWFVDSYDLSPEDHFEVQSVVQKYVDGAVSKTINMPAGSTKDDLGRLLLEYIKGLKGVTVYVDGSRDGQILNRLTEEETLTYIKKEKEKIEDHKTEDDVKCASGTCSI